MRRLLGALGCVAMVAGCGSSEERQAPSETPATTLPVGSADSPAWVAGRLPEGYQLVTAEERKADGGVVRITRYGQDPPHQDPSDASLVVKAIESDPPSDRGIEPVVSETEVRGHPTWSRLGGQIFVTGEAPAGVARARVTPSGPSGDAGATEVETASIQRGPDVVFWVAPMPEGTCSVEATAADDTNEQRRGLGPTGPLQGDPFASGVTLHEQVEAAMGELDQLLVTRRYPAVGDSGRTPGWLDPS